MSAPKEANLRPPLAVSQTEPRSTVGETASVTNDGSAQFNNSLHLSCCPACDYSLAGLTDAGICPECGNPYDQSCIILIGRGRGRFDVLGGGTWRSVVGTVFCALIVVWVAYGGRLALRNPSTVYWLVACTSMVCLQLYAKLFSNREPRTQLWLSDLGFAQILSTVEARRAMWIQRHMHWVYAAIVLLCGFVAGVTSAIRHFSSLSSCVALACSIMLIVESVVFWKRFGQSWRRGFDRPRPTLSSWTELDDDMSARIAPDRFRIRYRGMKRWGKINIQRVWLVDFEFKATLQVFQQVQSLISNWTLPGSRSI